MPVCTGIVIILDNFAFCPENNIPTKPLKYPTFLREENKTHAVEKETLL